MDTKRVIIAIALSFIIILAFQFLYTKFFPYTPATKLIAKKPKKEKPVVSNNTQDIETLIKKFKSYPVETPNYDSSLTESGVRFLRFKLKKYFVDVKKTKPVEMVSAPRYCLPIEIYLEKKTNLGTALFKGPEKYEKFVSKGKETLKFATNFNGLKVVKTITFKSDSYFLDLDVKLTNTGKGVIQDRLLLRGAFKPFVHGTHYVFKGPFYFTNHLEEVKMKKPLETASGKFKYLGYEGNYFMVALIPLNLGNNTLYATFRRLNRQVDEFILWLPKFKLAPGKSIDYKFKVYMGPKKLEDMEKEFPLLGKALYFGFFDIFAKPILYVLKFFHRYIPNYGWDIIVLTILLRILFFPLNQISFKSMKKMKEVQPIIERIRKKYKDDPEALNRELMNVYRTYKINPFSGCLPILIQIPIFIAFYEVLLMAIELRHAPFMLWINDLSAPERLYIGHLHIPYLGGIPLLTILMGISMYVQQKLTPTSADPFQSKLMLFMPIFFTILFVNFPSGLVLYWFVNNILSIAQQYITLKLEKA